MSLELRILIVEDEPLKADKIRQCVLASTLGMVLDIQVFGNSFDAASALRSQRWDLMVLDLNIPVRPGEPSRRNAGADFLQQIQARRDFNVPTHVIGITAFDDLLHDYAELFDTLTWNIIEYDHSADAWASRLSNKIQHIIASKSVFREVAFEYDLGIVTALEDPELSAVLDLPGNWKMHALPGDDTAYRIGKFTCDSREIKVVAASAIQVGMPAVTALAMKMIANFRPRYLGHCGIAAGTSGNFGDILIADKTWDYGSGKTKAGSMSDGTPFGGATFEPAPTPLPLDPELAEKFKRFAVQKELLRNIEAQWQGDRAKSALAVKVGPIASGAAVVENRHLIDAIRSHDRKLIGIEMEGFGIFMSARVVSEPRPKAFVIKSISDLGDQRKNDKYQRYAAFTSARFLHQFVTGILFE